MTPLDLAKSNTEHGHQAALICWCKSLKVKARFPKAQRIFAIPNQRDGAQAGARFKAEGVKAGVCDLFLPAISYSFPGLFIEMKKPGEERSKNGGLSDNQVEFISETGLEGYRVVVCYNWIEAATTIANYFGEFLTHDQILELATC